MICLKCNARSESMDCTYEEIKYGLCWKCIKELRKNGELDSNSTGDDLINKRFTLEMQYWKGNPQGRKLFDNLIGQEGMSVEELCNIASDLHSKCEELESVLKVYEDCLGKLEDENKELKEENEQLKETINEVKTDEMIEEERKEIYGDVE